MSRGCDCVRVWDPRRVVDGIILTRYYVTIM